MVDSPDDVARALLASLNEQVASYERVRDLSVEQNDAISKGQTEGLLQILGRKQDMIAAIDTVSRKVDVYRASYEPMREMVSSALRGQLEQSLEILKHVLGQIVALEDEGRALLENEQSHTNESAMQLQRGKAMNKAYGAAAPRPGSKMEDRNA